MQKKFSKIKITAKNKVEVTYSTPAEDGGSFTANEEHNGKPHEDFKKAMQRLAVHLAVISEFLPPKGVKNLETERDNSGEVEKFTVRGFTLGGDEDDEWIILSGYRLQSTGRALNFNTPKTDFEESDKSYKFTEDLVKCIAEVKKECELYLGGKYEDEIQSQLKFENETA